MNRACDEKGETFDKVLLEKSFTNAFLDVLSTMAGIYGEEMADSEASKEKPGGGITGVMILTGEKQSFATITIPKAAAFHIVSYMTGIDGSGLTEEDLNDGAAELINMICGRAKTFLAETEYHFQLTTPLVISGENYSILQKKSVVRLKKKFRVEEYILILELSFP